MNIGGPVCLCDQKVSFGSDSFFFTRDKTQKPFFGPPLGPCMIARMEGKTRSGFRPTNFLVIVISAVMETDMCAGQVHEDEESIFECSFCSGNTNKTRFSVRKKKKKNNDQKKHVVDTSLRLHRVSVFLSRTLSLPRILIYWWSSMIHFFFLFLPFSIVDASPCVCVCAFFIFLRKNKKEKNSTPRDFFFALHFNFL